MGKKSLSSSFSPHESCARSPWVVSVYHLYERSCWLRDTFWSDWKLCLELQWRSLCFIKAVWVLWRFNGLFSLQRKKKVKHHCGLRKLKIECFMRLSDKKMMIIKPVGVLKTNLYNRKLKGYHKHKNKNSKINFKKNNERSGVQNTFFLENYFFSLLQS